jgi:hypothetical protein
MRLLSRPFVDYAREINAARRARRRRRFLARLGLTIGAGAACFAYARAIISLPVIGGIVLMLALAIGILSFNHLSHRL